MPFCKEQIEHLERALGGGVYEFSADRKTLLLSDKSYDYGIPQWHRVDAITFPKGTTLPQTLYISTLNGTTHMRRTLTWCN